MRRIDLLVTQSRKDSENQDFTDTTGIDDESFLYWVNSAQERMQSLITAKNPSVFEAEKIVSVVANQEAYALPSDIFLGTRVENIEFSETGLLANYRQLKQGRLLERISGIPGVPYFYIRRSSTILLQPIPQSSSGLLRITYQKKLPKLDKRRGQVGTVVLTSDAITSLILDTTQLIDRDALLEEDFITVVDRYGNIKMQDIPIDDINEASGTVTITSGFTFQSGETIAAGDYVLRGAFSTTHSQLPEVCERYLVAYMSWKAFKKDSNDDSQEGAQEMAVLEADIMESFSEPDTDVDYIPVLDNQYLSLDVD